MRVDKFIKFQRKEERERMYVTIMTVIFRLYIYLMIIYYIPHAFSVFLEKACKIPKKTLRNSKNAIAH